MQVISSVIRLDGWVVSFIEYMENSERQKPQFSITDEISAWTISDVGCLEVIQSNPNLLDPDLRENPNLWDKSLLTKLFT